MQPQARTTTATPSTPTAANDDAARTKGPARWLIVLGILVVIGLAARYRQTYTPGSDFNYYLGVTGGVLMLALLLYPLRKRLRWLDLLGPTRWWFRIHMAFGLLGPTLILFHSGFTVGSVNAGVALACMLLVAGSGIVGRVIYRRIHHGLYGRKATLDELRTTLGLQDGAMHSKFRFVPQVEKRLATFERDAMQRMESGRSWSLLGLGLRARFLAWRSHHDLRTALKRHGAQRGWSRATRLERLRLADSYVGQFLDAVLRYAQLHTYEKLFGLWHVAHIPFVYMLALSGVVHVIAVHMY